jgi:hypothetical protein
MMNEIKKEIEKSNQYGLTENGAIGYTTTGTDLLDLNFKVPSLRGGINEEDEQKFITSLKENFVYTIKWLFFLRDIRGGLGERDSFVSLFKILYENYPETAVSLIDLIAEYGRWKDVVDIAFSGNKSLKLECCRVIKEQLRQDLHNYTENKPISLLSKWMPSINASKKSRIQALDIIKSLDIKNNEYRKMLSKLRKYIDVTEVKTCGNRWGEIDYNKVSSNANLRYSDAFLRHDETRRREYLDELSKPESKATMHVSALYPYEIWRKYLYNTNLRWKGIETEDQALEAMWSNLNDLGECGNTMCVCDGSGSMESTIPNTNVKAIDVARSLAVYFAERCEGEYKNRFIEFSSNPQFIDLVGLDTLRDKINHVIKYTDCSNTDIEKVFKLLLNTAIKHKMSQSDMPERILIVSDMEFDDATSCWGYDNGSLVDKALFDGLSDLYKQNGYTLPKLVFWNVNSRTNTVPVQENEAGVILLSGFSVNIVKMVMSDETDPWTVLKSMLDTERYQPIVDKLKGNQ